MERIIKHIHLVGIGGVAMGTLAMMLKERGYHITGSDQQVYPPMSEQLDQAGISCHKGYHPGNLEGAHLVVIGNALGRGNPEVEAVLNNHIPYCSMASALRTFFLADKEVIAVAGTHGKSTTTGLLAHIFMEAGSDPSFFIGGVSQNYGSNYNLGNGNLFIIEGDEYDSAFFEKWPKVIAYRPDHLVITSLEFDHADIYRDLEDIQKWFTYLVRLIPGNNSIVVNHNYKTLQRVTEGSLSNCIPLGDGAAIEWESRPVEGGQVVTLVNRGTYFSWKELEFSSQLLGDFNAENIALAALMALDRGVRASMVQEAVASYKGIKRRQEIIYQDERVVIMEDFAHHPSSIKAVTHAVHKSWPNSTLWQLYEPASATGSRNIFQEELPGSFIPGHPVMILRPKRFDRLPGDEQLDLDRLKKNLEAMKSTVTIGNSGSHIIQELLKGFDEGCHNVILIMSNGSFDHIYKELVHHFETD